jgi:prepilin-type N-terminal cleavage/methylation domain-containing protein
MVSLKNKSKGFTIVELLIVIVVIGILATLVIVTFTGIQQKARDSKRKTDINALNSHVEAYYASNGYYPTLKDLQTASFLSTSLKGFDPSALSDPKGGAISGTVGASNYAYVAAASSTSTAACDNTVVSSATNACDSYTATASLEAGGTYVKRSN